MRRTPFVLLLLCIIVLMTGCGRSGPEKAVQNELDRIRNLDNTSLKTDISYNLLQLSDGPAEEIGADAEEAAQLFFRDFSYQIDDSEIFTDKKTAAVRISVTNLDASALAKDLCREAIRSSLKEPDSSGISSSFTSMLSLLQKNTYPTITQAAAINLGKNEEGEWFIIESPDLEDALTGGFLSCMNDPYLLSPAEVLSILLEPFSSFTAADWKTFLNLEDAFQTGSSLAKQLDDTLAEAIAASYSCVIIRSSVDPSDHDQAKVRVNLTGFDLPSICNACREQLSAYAGSTESILATDEEISEKFASILLQELQNSTSVITHSVDIPMTNNGYTWTASLQGEFSNVLLGDVDKALKNISGWS